MQPTQCDFTILMADDDDDDFYLLKEAFEELGMNGKLCRVSDGVELLDYLLCRGRFVGREDAPRPNLILLDLNMPRMDGRQALAEIKSDPVLKQIPVAVWTTSQDKEETVRCHQAGADLFLSKPSVYSELVNSVKTVVMKFIGY